MKIKGIGKAEQSVEKLVLGVVALVFLAVLTMQFTLQPNQVTVDGQQLPPERAFEPVATAAEQLVGQVRNTQVEMPERPNLTMAENFSAGLKAPVAPRPELIAALGLRTPLGDSVGGGDEPTGDSKYAKIDVPAPVGVVTHAFASTLHPAAVIQTEGLANLVPAQQPFDKSAVSIEATYDGISLREALEFDPEGEQRPFPLIWRSEIAIIGVEIERERLVEGEWTELNPVEQPPGAANMLGIVTTGEINGAELAAAVEEARAQSMSIQRPRYYPVIAGSHWAPPRMFQVAADSEPTEDELKIAGRLKEIDKLDIRIEKLEEQIADAGNQTRQPPAPGGGGRGRGGRGTTPPTRPQDDTKNDPKDRPQRRLEGYQQQREEAVAALVELGYDPIAGEDEMDQSWRNEPVTTLLDDASVPIWAHDLRVVPGETYRYRMSVVVNNPAFGRSDFLDEDQQHLAQSPVIRGQWSEWSEPVEVLDDQYFFVSTASAGGEISSTPRATIEVYRFYYGYWRRATESIEPGDTVATELKFANPDLLPIYDLESLKLAKVEPDDNPVDPPTGRPPTDPRDPRDPRPRGPGGAGPGDPRQPPNDPKQDEPKLPENAEPGPDRLPVVLDVVLLDVTSWPSVATSAAGDSPTEVVLRDRHGNLIGRRPDLDKQTPLYRLVADSARAAKERDKPADD